MNLSDQGRTRWDVLMYTIIYAQSQSHTSLKDCVENSGNEVRMVGPCEDLIKMEDGEMLKIGVTDVDATPGFEGTELWAGAARRGLCMA